MLNLYTGYYFSTSDNAILAFWLVHFISVPSHYTYVWPYMEINAANVAWHKSFCGKPSFVDKECTRKKHSVSCLQKKYKKLRTMPSQYQRKHVEKAIKFGMKTVRIRLGSFKSCKMSNEHRNFTHSWRLRNNNNFYLNVTEWLASPGGTKFSKPIEEMSKEKLNIFLKRFCTSARKKDGTLSVNKSSSMKSIWEPPMIVSFARCCSINRSFPLSSLSPLLLRQIKH